MFPDEDDADLSRLYLLRMASPPTAEIAASPFDLAYDLEDLFGFVRVEPDLDTELFPTEPDRAETFAMAGDVLGCWVNGSSPSDRGWAPRMLKAHNAWDYSEAEGRPDRGDGIVIAQVDTGYTGHPELTDAIDPGQGWDFLGNDNDPLDPLEKILPLDNPGHGTGTASVAVSRGTIEAHSGGQQGGTGTPGEVTGTAPQATLVPIRAIRSVVRLTQVNVARTINLARKRGFPIITMSLGGFPSIALWYALRKAVRENILVLAAAGNCVKLVVWPARYDNCIAVAGINSDRLPWRGSCRGRAVDVSAPGELIWRAYSKKNGAATDYGADGTGEGTSYAVALTAGVAALWLAHHGRNALVADLAWNETLQDRFRSLLKQTANRPGGWDGRRFGAGIVDADALLRQGPQPPAATAMMGAAGEPGDSYADLVDATFADETAEAVLGAAATTGLSRAEKEKYGLEIIWHTYRARLAASRSITVDSLARSTETVAPYVSEQLRAVLVRPGTEPLRRLMQP